MADRSLGTIGLTEAEQAAYELLVEQPAATADELAAAWTRPEPLPAVLAALEERALISSTPGSPVPGARHGPGAGVPPELRYRPVAPDVAFGALLADYEEQLDQARQHLAVLDAAYRARPDGQHAGTVIEVITGERAIRQRLRQVQRGIRRQISCLAKPPYFDNDGTTSAALDLLRSGRTCRTVYARSAIEHPGALATVEELIRTGQRGSRRRRAPVRPGTTAGHRPAAAGHPAAVRPDRRGHRPAARPVAPHGAAQGGQADVRPRRAHPLPGRGAGRDAAAAAVLISGPARWTARSGTRRPGRRPP